MPCTLGRERYVSSRQRGGKRRSLDICSDSHKSSWTSHLRVLTAPCPCTPLGCTPSHGSGTCPAPCVPRERPGCGVHGRLEQPEATGRSKPGTDLLPPADVRRGPKFPLRDGNSAPGAGGSQES